MLIGLTLAGAPAHRAVAQAAADTSRSSAAVAFAERAVVRALYFTAGDAQGLRAGKEDFTDSAWTALMTQYAGFLDSRAGPEFANDLACGCGRRRRWLAAADPASRLEHMRW
jgi:hypothetical protein